MATPATDEALEKGVAHFLATQHLSDSARVAGTTRIRLAGILDSRGIARATRPGNDDGRRLAEAYDDFITGRRTISEAKAFHRVSELKLRKALAANGHLPPPRAASKETVQQAVSAYIAAEGSLIAIATRFRLSHSTLTAALRRAGHAVKPRPAATAAPRAPALRPAPAVNDEEDAILTAKLRKKGYNGRLYLLNGETKTLMSYGPLAFLEEKLRWWQATALKEGDTFQVVPV